MGQMIKGAGGILDNFVIWRFIVSKSTISANMYLEYERELFVWV